MRNAAFRTEFTSEGRSSLGNREKAFEKRVKALEKREQHIQ